MFLFLAHAEPRYILFQNSVDHDWLASEEASQSRSTLFSFDHAILLSRTSSVNFE